MTFALMRSELKRYLRLHFWKTVAVSLGVGFLIQLSGAEGTGGEKRMFFNLIFSFWMGMTSTVYWFGTDRKYITRLLASGVPTGKLLMSRAPVVCFGSFVHAVLLWLFSLVLFANHGTMQPNVSVLLNELRYSETELQEWGDSESEFYTVLYEDEFERDKVFRDKERLGVVYKEAKNSGNWLSFDLQKPVPSFARWYSFFLASFSGGWIGIALTSFCSYISSIKLIPFFVAIQIMFASITADASSVLFRSVRDVLHTYAWWEPVHLISLLAPVRYLVILLESGSIYDILFSLDTILVYVIILGNFMVSITGYRHFFYSTEHA